MKFISYAQNFEDVILWRALKHVKNGFYIDIGAAWPVYSSVTKSFYDAGWSGINVEPNPEFFSQYALERPRDINLQVAVSDTQGEQVINFIANTGLSTLDGKVTEVHVDQGYAPTPSKVKVTTLNHIFDEYVQDRENVHFLKVDVEGLEPLVINSCDWNKNRPWIIVVEATVPLSQELNHLEWETALTKADYIYVFMDGLNRYYVSKEHSELIEAFKYPANCFDEFVLHSEQIKIVALAERDQELYELRKELINQRKNEKLLLKKIEQNHHENWQLRHQIALIYQSSFWRYGAPLRFALKYAGKLYRFVKYFNKKESPKALIRFIFVRLNNYPNFKASLKQIIKKTGMQNIFSRMVYDSVQPPIIHQASSLSKKARIIKSRIESVKVDSKNSDKE